MLTPEFEQSLQELLERVDGEWAALLCAEAVPWRRHRSLIADALVVRGVAVEHVLGASRTQPHVLRPWVRVPGPLGAALDAGAHRVPRFERGRACRAGD